MIGTGTTDRLRDEWLARLLVGRRLLDEGALSTIRSSGAAFVAAEATRRGLLTKQQLAQAVEAQYGVPFADPPGSELEKAAVALVPEKLCRKHLMIPLRAEGEQLSLLMVNPLDSAAIDDAASVSGRKPMPVFGLPERVEELILQAFDSSAAVYDLLKKLPEDASVECLNETAEPAPVFDAANVAAPVVRLANAVIAQAIGMGASDIHVEHDEALTLVRYRIDGDLRNALKLPKSVGEGPLVSRIKIMANLDVADRRRPQDGRAKLLVDGREIGLRVSTIPTAFGEKAVLRVLDARQAERPLETLGMRPAALERLIKLASAEKGLLLTTGPTGSGKTTTLYSILNRLKSVDVNIVTVEDPIEYRLQGINQVQVNEKSGLTFATVLRSVLRQDPDVVLVGEIRDRETADIAFQAALTGHLVLSTLHTNDALSTINRLVDMKVELFKIVPALVGVVAQRLARRQCPECRVTETPAPLVAALLRNEGLPERQYKAQGCAACHYTGLRGRIALIELLDLGAQPSRDMLNSGMDLAAFREEALRRGWLMPLSQDVLWHLANGDIPAHEALTFLSTPAPAAEPPKAAAPAPAKAPILVVDDNEDNRTLVRDALASEGYEILEAASGPAALELLERHRPALVLLDLMMPGMDGFEVLKRLRARWMQQLPVMVLTAMSESESQAVAFEIGADDYVTKPFNPRVFRARVRALHRRTESR